MGAENEKRTNSGNGEVKGNTNSAGNGNGSTAGNSTSAAPAAGNPNSGAGVSTGNGNGSSAGKTEEKKIPQPRLLDVNGEDSAPIPEVPKKKQTRKKKTAKKKTEETSAFSSQQISMLLVSLSGVVASRPNLSMFALSEMEAEQIATPLSNILAKSEKLSAVGEHADAIALVSACLIIMLPRFMLYFETVKQNKIKANGGVKIVDKRKDKEAKSAGNNREASRTSSGEESTSVDGVLAAIPAII